MLGLKPCVLVLLCTAWTHSARWCSMIMASALLFGEITAVVFTANKAPGGARRSDSVSLKCSRLLGGDPPSPIPTTIPAFSQVPLLLSVYPR